MHVMAYILYIPVEDTYTQKEFESLKDIAQWSIVAALNEPVELSHILYINVGEEIFKRKQFAALADLARWAVVEALNPTEEVASVPEPVPTPNPIVDLVVAREEKAEPHNYTALSKTFLDEAFSTAFRFEANPGGNAHSSISDEDVLFFLQILARYSRATTSIFLSSESGIHWDSLPAEFIVELQKKAAAHPILEQKKDRRGAVIFPAHPTAVAVFKVINAFRSWSFVDKSWSDYTPTYKGVPFTTPYLNTLLTRIIGEWLSNAPISDELHDLMIKLITMRFLIKTTPEATMGSQDFLTFYHEKLSTVFPSSFHLWVVRGSHYRHCKKALEELGIAQVRRAGGQKFVGIREVAPNIPMQYVADLQPVDWHDLPSGSYECPYATNEYMMNGCMFAPI